MQFILTDLQKEIKENAEKLLSEKIDNLETIRKIDDRIKMVLFTLVVFVCVFILLITFYLNHQEIQNEQYTKKSFK